MSMKMKVGFNRFVEHINRYFQEAVEVVLAMGMFILGIYTLLPVEILPIQVSIYATNLNKAIFALFLLVPSGLLLWKRLRHDIQVYVFTYKHFRKRCLLWITIFWLYLGALRLLIAWYPPYYVFYFTLATATALCYMRLSK